MVALWALTLARALALTPAAIAPALAIPRRQASNLCGDSVVERVGPDPLNVPRRTTAKDSTRYALFDPHDPPETHQRSGSIGRSVLSDSADAHQSLRFGLAQATEGGEE